LTWLLSAKRSTRSQASSPGSLRPPRWVAKRWSGWCGEARSSSFRAAGAAAYDVRCRKAALGQFPEAYNNEDREGRGRREESEAESWAPTSLAWGHDNRTCGFRIVGHGPGPRAETRIPGGDVNPYLSFAALLAAGLHGIENELELPPALEGNASASGAERFPSSLREAISALEEGTPARVAFGGDVVDHYLNYARTEQALFDGVVTTGSASGSSSAVRRPTTSMPSRRRQRRCAGHPLRALRPCDSLSQGLIAPVHAASRSLWRDL
jgi:hypothetical protein